MDEIKELTYWMAVAHLPRWTTERINRLIISVIHQQQMTWSDYFSLEIDDMQDIFKMQEKEADSIMSTKKDLARLSFLVEQLLNEGYQIIPINSPAYSSVLKENLKIKSSPPVLYLKGKKKLLQEQAVAIVGSRKAGNSALKFTDNVAKNSVKNGKIVVSGFAKGVDQQALESALEAGGKSIIVLPQGIMTFKSGYKKYYQKIVNGEVLVLSTFFPQASWSVGLAMARNVYIYGLANEIYVAESDSKGGTWEGVNNGLKRGRIIYVRVPEKSEKNANQLLVNQGAVPVDHSGKPVAALANTALSKSTVKNLIEESKGDYTEDNLKQEDIFELLAKGSFTVNEIKSKTGIAWDTRKLARYLNKNPDVKQVAGNPKKYTIINSGSLFL